MRLIDADALAKVKFHGYPEIEITPSDVNAEAYKRGWNDAIDAIIESAPSIDAVKHGEWIRETLPVRRGRWYIDAEGDVRCTVCKTKCLRDDIGINILSNYCPNCGADMRGEQDVEVR